MAITTPGIGSGLDVNSIVSQLMGVERQPLAVLDQKKAENDAKLSAYGVVKSALSSFQGAVKGLSNSSSFQSIKASASDTTVASMSATSIATPGSYSMEVYKLAQSHKVATNTAYASVDTTIGTGNLIFQFGTDNGGGSFTNNPAKAAQTVTIDAAHSSLAGIRDAINTASIGVTATIVNDGTGNKLVLSSKDSGAANGLKITSADAGLSGFVYDPSTGVKNMSETQTAQDASIKLDGLAISKASNTITDAIQGVTINLLKQTNSGNPGNPITVTVASDTSGVSTAVNAFVSAFNDLNKTISTLSSYDAKTKKGGLLLGDSSVSTINFQIRRTITAAIAGVNGPYRSTSDIGISFQKDGTLSVNSAKLSSAISANPNAVAGIFASLGSSSDSQVKYIGASSNTRGGSYGVYVSSLATQGNSTGASVLPATIDALNPVVIDTNNNTFEVTVDGAQSGTVTLNQGSYTSGAALATEIQSKINGDSTLQSRGISVNVSYDSTNQRFVTTSASYGSSSSVSYTMWGTTTAATLGLNTATETKGSNVVGQIGGGDAVGSGQFLTATGGGADGIKLQVTGGAAGANRGSVNYSQGIAVSLSKMLDEMMTDHGVVASGTERLNRSSKDIATRRDTINSRLASVEARYRKQFTSLDTMVSSMTKTSNFLTQQFNSMAKTSG